MRYVIARCNDYQRDEAYRIYVTDALRLIGGLNIRYVDVFDYEVESRTADEVINDMKDKLNSLGD